ncbi:MAG: hypothetical protein ACPGRD_10070, partial [Planktomarina sp.]
MSAKGRLTKDGIRLYNPEDFVGMAEAGRVAATILDDITQHIFVGQTTGEVDRIITNLGVLDVVDGGLKIVETADGVTEDELRAAT